MNCKNCNAFVPDDSAFCPECGQKVEAVSAEPEATFCPNCGSAMADGSNFCEVCGFQAQPAEPAKKEKKAGIPKKALLIGAAAVAVILVAVLVIALFSGAKGPSYMLYVTDGDYMIAKNPSAKAQELDEDIYGGGVLNKSGDKLFIVGEEGKLMYVNPGNLKKDAVTVAKGISDFTINAQGTTVFYTKDGKLVAADLKDKSETIAKDIDDFYVSHDGKTVVYLKTEEGETELHKVTMSGLKAKKDTKIKSGKGVRVNYFADDGKDIIFTVENTLYIQNGNKDAVKIAENASIEGKIHDNCSFYYVEVDEEKEEVALNFFDGKKSKELTKDYSDWMDYAVDEAALVYYFTEEEETTYFLAVGNTVSEIKAEDVYEILITNDAKNLYVLHDFEKGEGTLSKAAISGKKAKELKKTDSEVMDVFVRGEVVGWFKDVKDGEGTLYVDGKKVSDDVSTSGLSYNEEKGWLMFYKDEDTLYRCKGAKATKIADEVKSYAFSPKGELVVLHEANDKGECTLSLYTGSKLKKLAEDVTGVAFITSPFVED